MQSIHIAARDLAHAASSSNASHAMQLQHTLNELASTLEQQHRTFLFGASDDDPSVVESGIGDLLAGQTLTPLPLSPLSHLFSLPAWGCNASPASTAMALVVRSSL